jgi:ribosomal protein S18 acetylase RimI-like enzyme
VFALGAGLQADWTTSMRSRTGAAMLHIDDAVTAADLDTIRALLREYQALLRIDLCFPGFAAELDGLPGLYARPDGRLVLANDGGMPVGCVALRPLAGTRCELKRLFVRPGSRGLGTGRALTVRIIAEARTIGYTEIVLDTLPSMAAAQRLYEKQGFREIAPYCVNPIAGTRYLGKDLRGTG